ncbi:MAG: DUF2062 domain-containing protein [Cyanobacteria bacterium REEB459]|nr:DUF2062 domain-containing protein [Cyanobacteria bacterium REEB459]
MTTLLDPQAITPRPTLQPTWQRTLKYYYLRLLRLQGSPEYLARGIASGVFSGCFPLFGLQIIIGLALATLLRGNRLMAAAATWVSNPLTYLPLFSFNYQVGYWLLGRPSNRDLTELDSWQAWMDMGTEVSTRLLLGSCIVGLGAAITSYYGGLALIYWLRKKPRWISLSLPQPAGSYPSD